MWSIEVDRSSDGIHRWSRITESGSGLSFGQVASAWETDASFRAYWITNLRAVSFDAYCWECPPVSDANRGRPFECVFVSSPSLARMSVDAYSFSGQFPPGGQIATFRNLGGDAMLVAPCPEEAGNFAHLASFAATASAGRQEALWKAVGEALASRIGPRPLWLSTAGHGVAWLHVRLDWRPKYYRHAPYMRT